ncbi:MAG: hypothetical protein ACKO01_12300 [Erythrobacter sp.]
MRFDAIDCREGVVAVNPQPTEILAPVAIAGGAKKILRRTGTDIRAAHYGLVTAETPLPSKRLVIRSRKASVVNATEAFFLRKGDLIGVPFALSLSKGCPASGRLSS